jgi:hypothetical protein
LKQHPGSLGPHEALLEHMMYVHFVSVIARALRGLFERVIRFLEQDSQRNHAIIVRYSTYRWCDATERALSNELIGQGGWLTRAQ